MRFELNSKSIPILLVAAGMAVYANSCSGPFIIDDLAGIVENPDIRHWGGWWNTVFVSLNSPISGRPLMWLTLAANYAVHGLDTWGYHAVNVALHLACMLLVYGIVRRSLRLPYWIGRFDNPTAVRIAGLTAVLWGVHPLLTESVVYVSQRTELLAGVSYLLTMYFSIRAWESRKRIWYVAAVTATAIGLLAKEQVASVPVTVLVYDSVFLSGSVLAALRRRPAFYIGLAATWSIFVALTAMGPRSATVGFGLGMTPWDSLRTQAGVLVHYLRLAFWPYPLCVSYSDWPIEHSWLHNAPQGIFILMLLALTGWSLYRRWWPGFVGAWFFLILAPSSSFVPIISEIAAERRMYLPLLSIVVIVLGFGLWLSGVLHRAWPELRAIRPISHTLVGLMIVGASAATINRNRQFQTVEGIMSATLAARPGDEIVRGAWMQNSAIKGKLDLAYSLYQDGLRLNPASESVRYNWGECLALAGNIDSAIGEFQNLLIVNPGNHRAQRRLGQLMLEKGRASEAVDYLASGLWNSPEYFAGYNNLGVALASLNRNDEAISSFRTAIELNPTLADAHYNLGSVLMKQRQWQKALVSLREAVRLSPHDVAIRSALAEILEITGDIKGALEECRAILALQPDSECARMMLHRLGPNENSP